MPGVNELLRVLPPFTNDSILIESNQNVPDIIKEVIEAHSYFSSDYDFIYYFFDRDTTEKTCKDLFQFLKNNVRYEIEGEEKQTTKSPAAILATGSGDCKHYAGFIAGVLAAIERNTGFNINWKYRFASYSILDKDPGHVFVVVNDNGKEFWIDPVLNRFNERMQPSFIVDKKIKDMSLYRLSGVGDIADEFNQADILPDLSYNLDQEDKNLSPELLQAIHLLLFYNILDTTGTVNDDLLQQLAPAMPSEQYQQLVDARQLLNTATVSGLFSDIWRGVKKVSLAVPRGAYLSIVALNFFGTATRLKQVTTDQTGINKVRDKWYDLGGDWKNLESAISNGSQRNRIFGIGAAAAVLPAWVVTASAIIAAITPIINGVLKAQQQAGQLPANFDPALLNDPYQGSSQNSFIDWIKNNMLIIAAVAAGGIYYFTRRRKRA